MKFLIALVAIVCCVSASPITPELRQSWEAYKIQYKLVGRFSPEQEHQKMINYANNLKIIAAHNYRYDQGLETYDMGVNQFTHMSFDEVQEQILNNVQPVDGINGKDYPEGGKALPARIDWRENGFVNDIRDQGACGSCWSFSAVATLESAYSIKKGARLPSFSEQELVECTKNQSTPLPNNNEFRNYGCNGGMPDAAMKYFAYTGSVYRQNYKSYNAKDTEACDRQGKGDDLKNAISKITTLSFATETQIKEALNNYPVSIGLYACDSFLKYKSGIFNDSACKSLLCLSINHAVNFVGYGTETVNGVSTPVWYMRNSWATTWGENGYMKLAISNNIACASRYVAFLDFA